MDLMQQESKADDQWTVAMTKLPEICSSDSIQHCQTHLHVLNNCPTALKQGRYNVRHDKVLLILFRHLQANVPPSFCVTADLDGADYRIPQYLPTDLRPDIIVWNDHQIHLFELTVC